MPLGRILAALMRSLCLLVRPDAGLSPGLLSHFQRFDYIVHKDGIRRAHDIVPFPTLSARLVQP